VVDVRYHGSVKDVQALFGPNSACSPFDRLSWFALLEETGQTPLIALAQDEGERAALVLAPRRARLEAFTNWYSFTWRPLGTLSQRSASLITAIAADLRQRVPRVSLSPVPGEDGTAGLLSAAFEEAGWRVSATQCDTNHVLDVAGRSFAQYRTTLPGRLRTTLARKAKKIETRILDRFEPAAYAHYERIYAQSWKPREGEPAMLRAFARNEGAAGRLRLGLAFHDGEPIAAQFWTVEHGTAYIHKLAHLESHKHLSAGSCLSAALFEHTIDRDHAALIDFGTGDEPYKADWMDSTRPRYRIDCLDPGNPRAWVELALRAARRVRDGAAPRLAPSALDG